MRSATKIKKRSFFASISGKHTPRGTIEFNSKAVEGQLFNKEKIVDPNGCSDTPPHLIEISEGKIFILRS